MKLSDIILKASGLGALETPEGRMVRFIYLLDNILPFIPGNLIEVGAGLGLTTRILCQAAQKYERKVLVIDPFESGWSSMPVSYGEPYPFQKFYDNVKEFDNLTVCKSTSLDHKSIEAIKEFSPIAFVFLDGLQYRNNVYQELFLMAKNEAAVICVDDVNRMTADSQVPLAIKDFFSDTDCIYKSNYERVGSHKTIEGYLIYDKSDNIKL